MAMGARATDVLRVVGTDGLRLAAIGAGLGLFLSLAVARLLRGLLFGVGAYDPAAFVAALVVLALVTLAACAVPAWRRPPGGPTAPLRTGRTRPRRGARNPAAGRSGKAARVLRPGREGA